MKLEDASHDNLIEQKRVELTNFERNFREILDNIGYPERKIPELQGAPTELQFDLQIEQLKDLLLRYRKANPDIWYGFFLSYYSDSAIKIPKEANLKILKLLEENLNS